MKRIIHKIVHIDRTWLLVGALILSGYLYLCFAYNLQFYTEDERYVQLDMTNLASLYQWGMGNYRVSASFGCFIYYPLTAILNVVSGALVFLLGSNYKLVLIPMMISKLSHSIMVVLGWFWFAFECGRLMQKKWQLPPWTGLLCFLFTAMLPINIFLVKTNNYDSIYNIFCLVAVIYFLRYHLYGKQFDLGTSFFLFAIALQEKFAAYPVFMVFLCLVPFFFKIEHNRVPVRQMAIVIGAITAGSLLPSIIRLLAEIFWAPDSSVFLKHLSQYDPFRSFSKSLGTGGHFLNIDSSFFTLIVKYAFPLHILGFGVWGGLIVWGRKKITIPVWQSGIPFGGIFAGIFQIFWLIWAFASVWYEVPETGRINFTEPLPGTYLPPHLSDSNAVFYQGAGHMEYIFIRLMNSVGFFKSMVYSPILILLVIGPVITFYSFRMKDENTISMARLSVIVFNLTMGLVVLVNFTGVPFGHRYTNIYLTLLGVSAFLNFLVVWRLFIEKFNLNKKKFFPGVVLLCSLFFILEIFPYGPSYQSFGNWFYPACSLAGWGEPTSLLVQAGRKDSFLKDAIGKTFTTYTGLAVERPFFTPLINLRLIRSRKEKTKGKRRVIRYLLAEKSVLGQNPWLKNVLAVAKTVDDSVVWKAQKNGCTSAWLIDLYKLGLYDYHEQLNLEKVERHYRGEWVF